MNVLEDIKLLKEHYTNRINWYYSAIDRLETDIQKLWNEYFTISFNPTSRLKLMDIERCFSIMKLALEYFKESVVITEKKLEDLKKQEYAIISTNDKPIN
jgi:hypothetical protein